MKHVIHRKLLRQQVTVALIGAGGTGSNVLTGLAQLHYSMKALGHPGGVQVEVVDNDKVSEFNVGRQMFFPSDVGRSKAEVLVQRINMAMGLDWTARNERLKADSRLHADIVIGCVDNRKARRIIAGMNVYGSPAYYLDCGNTAHGGQVILGELGKEKELPHVGDLFPELLDATLDDKDEAPSCSMADALSKQSLFINRAMALYALNLLSDLFRFGQLDYHGVFVQLKTARTTPLRIDPAVWERMGYSPAREAQAA